MNDRDPVTEAVIGAAIEVHRELGPGLLESVYHQCLCYELTLRGIEHRANFEVPIVYKGVALDTNLKIDILLSGKLVIELKAVEAIAPIHEAQLLTYLKLAQIRLGLILNFIVQLMKDGVKRKIFG